MAPPQKWKFPPDEVLAAGVQEKGMRWVADELGIPPSTLSVHLKKQGLPTTRKAKELEVSEALKEVARLVD